MTERFVICDHGVIEASLIPDRLLGRPGFCPGGIYDTILVRKGEPVDWEEHWGRFMAGCDHIGADTGSLMENVTLERVSDLVRKSSLAEGRARLRLEVFLNEQVLASGQSVRFIAAVWPVKVEPKSAIVVSLGQTRRSYGDLSYNYKMLGRRAIEQEMENAFRRGCSDVIFLNHRDEICEGGYSNVWILADDILMTPALESPCLPGITRKKIIRKARATGVRVIDDRPLGLEEFRSADGVFLSSSVRGFHRVNAIEGVQTLGSLSPDSAINTLLADNILSG